MIRTGCRVPSHHFSPLGGDGRSPKEEHWSYASPSEGSCRTSERCRSAPSALRAAPPPGEQAKSHRPKAKSHTASGRVYRIDIDICIESIYPDAMLDFAVLGLLMEQPRHGYELKRSLGELGFWKVSFGSLYPALRRLEKRGAIEAVGRYRSPQVVHDHRRRVARPSTAARGPIPMPPRPTGPSRTRLAFLTHLPAGAARASARGASPKLADQQLKTARDTLVRGPHRHRKNRTAIASPSWSTRCSPPRRTSPGSTASSRQSADHSPPHDHWETGGHHVHRTRSHRRARKLRQLPDPGCRVLQGR